MSDGDNTAKTFFVLSMIVLVILVEYDNYQYQWGGMFSDYGKNEWLKSNDGYILMEKIGNFSIYRKLN